MTAPYYQDDLVTLYQGDCLEITEWLVADVLVTDPPYGQSYRSGRAPETSRVARSIANDETTEVRDSALEQWGRKPRMVFEGRDIAPLPAQARLVWHKPGSGMGDLSMPWKPDYEFVAVSGKGFRGSRDTSVLSFPLRVFRGDLEHPHMKPQGLMESLIAKTPPRNHRGSIRGKRVDARRGPEPGPEGYRCGAGRALLRGHREAARATGIRLLGSRPGRHTQGDEPQ